MIRMKSSLAHAKPQSQDAPSPSADPPPLNEKELQQAFATAVGGGGGDFSISLKLIDDHISRYSDLAGLHSTKGSIHFQAPSQTNDFGEKVEHLKKVLECNRRAFQLAPNSITFSHHHAVLLFEQAQNTTAEGYDYDAVIEACKHALLLKNPTDPMEDLMDVGGNYPSPVERIGEVKKKLEKIMEDVKRNKKTSVVVEDKLEKLVSNNSLSKIKEEIKSLQRKEDILSCKCFARSLS